MQELNIGRAETVEEGATLVINLSQIETWALDYWIGRHVEPRPTRSEAVYRLVLMGLGEHPGQ